MQSTITDLSLSGGGPKGAGHVGSLLALDDFGMLPHLQRVNGTSVGSMIGLLLAVGMTPTELADLIRSHDFKKLLDDKPKKLGNSGLPIINMLNSYIKTALKKAKTAYDEAQNLSEKHKENQELIQIIFKKPPPENIAFKFTFKDLKKLHENDPIRFKLFSTNAVYSHAGGTLKTQLFSDEVKIDVNAERQADPMVNLVDACRASASLPFVLTPHQIGNTDYQDGGTLNNTLWDHQKKAENQLILIFKDPDSTALLNAWEAYRAAQKEYDQASPGTAKGKAKLNLDEKKKIYENTPLSYSAINRTIRHYAAHHAFKETAQNSIVSIAQTRESGIRSLLAQRPDAVLLVNTPGIKSTDFNKAKNKEEFLFLYNYFSTASALIEKNLGTAPTAQGDTNNDAFKQRIKLGMLLLEHFQAAGGEKAKTFNQKQKFILDICKKLIDKQIDSATVFQEYSTKCGEHRHKLGFGNTTSSKVLEKTRKAHSPFFNQLLQTGQQALTTAARLSR